MSGHERVVQRVRMLMMASGAYSLDQVNADAPGLAAEIAAIAVEEYESRPLTSIDAPFATMSREQLAAEVCRYAENYSVLERKRDAFKRLTCVFEEALRKHAPHVDVEAIREAVDNDRDRDAEPRVPCTVCGHPRALTAPCSFVRCPEPLKDWREERAAARPSGDSSA